MSDRKVEEKTSRKGKMKVERKVVDIDQIEEEERKTRTKKKPKKLIISNRKVSDEKDEVKSLKEKWLFWVWTS